MSTITQMDTKREPSAAHTQSDSNKLESSATAELSCIKNISSSSVVREPSTVGEQSCISYISSLDERNECKSADNADPMCDELLAVGVREEEQRPRDWSHLLQPIRVRDAVKAWLLEDTPNFDYAGFVVGDKMESAVLVCKSPGVLAGVPFFEAIFSELDCTVEWMEDTVKEGEQVQVGMLLATVRGKARSILLGERVALNCLSRASGIATQARELVSLATHSGPDEHARWKGAIAGTRKTTPGFRIVEKYSMLVGGASTHRYDLSSMVMLKDNHIWSAGNITKILDGPLFIKAVTKARLACGFSTKIEVECRSLTEAIEAAQAGCDVVMLDNFESKALHDTARSIKDRFGSRVLIEASGGITSTNLLNYLSPNVDVISLGAMTLSARSVDFSLKISVPGHDPNNPLVSIVQ